MIDLPGYTWDGVSQRYRNISTGRYVSRGEIVTVLDASVDAAKARIIALTNAVYEKQIAPSVWLEQMKTEVKRLSIQNRALGAGGFDQLSPNDYSSLGGTLAAEYRHLTEFAADIDNLTLPQALNRAGMYAGTARKQYFKGEDLEPSGPDTVIIERRTLGAADHCEKCVEYWELGWQRQGVLPIPGDGSPCGGNCKCNKVSKEVPISEVDGWLNTKR